MDIGRDRDKLKDNALSSIRLGVEDFGHGKSDPARALSAVRNLFSGILLLFKYGIVQAAPDPASGFQLIKGKSKRSEATIGLREIKERFEQVGLKTDWEIVETLQRERNDIEHCHPLGAVGGTEKFLADTFPVLRDFITNELHASPSQLLGLTWQTMLKHHAFFIEQRRKCIEAWQSSPLPDGATQVALEMQCERCGSSLVRPSEVDVDGSEWKVEWNYTCEGCSFSARALTRIEETLQGLDVIAEDERPPVEECPECLHRTYVYSRDVCLWCEYALRYLTCAQCGCGLTIDDQRFDGFCRRHAHIRATDPDWN
jgi:hypothetical protein